MELSQDEKDRIIAEEKLRFETKQQLTQEKRGAQCGGWEHHGHGCGHRRSFWRGLIAGIILSVLFSFLCHYHRYGGFCGHNACSYGAPAASVPAPQAVPQN